jgi:hypothetical protein
MAICLFEAELLLLIDINAIERSPRRHNTAECHYLLGSPALTAKTAQLKFVFSGLRELGLIAWLQVVFSHDCRWDGNPKTVPAFSELHCLCQHGCLLL